MSEGTLFNPGFLGAHFNWWIGQIASDSTWRDNMLSSKFESKEQISGQSRRYKVRIIGLHDQGEEEISSQDLPWAQVMYPVTGGGGQANAGATSALRQGMFVFGFFLDGQDQQVPVIMGVLGNNAQTQLATSIGGSKVTNTQPGSLAVSGYANPADGNKDPYIKVPDEGLVITKPKDQDTSQECADIPPGVQVDQYGLRRDRQPTSFQLRDIQSASAEAEARNLTRGTPEFINFVKTAVQNGIKARCEAANSPTSPTKPGATKENVDAVHEQSKADIVRNDYYHRKTAILSPCDKVKSALKAIQVALENLTKDIDKILNAVQSYVDAVSLIFSQIQELINNFACEIAKYMKIIFDKIMEYIMKQINKSLAKTVNLIPPNQRNKYFDVKKRITELITCLFSKITNNLCDQIRGFLNGQLKKELPIKTKPSTPTTPICSVEGLTGNIISGQMPEINKTVTKILDNVNNFLYDILSGIGEITKFVKDKKNLIGDVTGSITSALSFRNISLNIFGCELTPSCPASDYFIIQNGSGAAANSQQPRVGEVDSKAQNPTTKITPEPAKPFASPGQNQEDLKSDS